jgi:hypothetical protein
MELDSGPRDRGGGALLRSPAGDASAADPADTPKEDPGGTGGDAADGLPRDLTTTGDSRRAAGEASEKGSETWLTALTNRWTESVMGPLSSFSICTTAADCTRAHKRACGQ